MLVEVNQRIANHQIDIFRQAEGLTGFLLDVDDQSQGVIRHVRHAIAWPCVFREGVNPVHDPAERVAQADPNRPQSLPARALLHARAGT